MMIALFFQKWKTSINSFLTKVKTWFYQRMSYNKLIFPTEIMFLKHIINSFQLKDQRNLGTSQNFC